MIKVAVQQGQNMAAPARMSIARLTWINVAKDLRLEWRSRDVFNSMMFFALVVVVVFSFAFERDDSRPVMGGLIWIAFLFSTTMALNQSWARELRNGVLDAYRVSPAPAEALFLGKCLGNFILIMLLECLMAPLFVVFYNLSSVGPLWQLVLISLLGTWALVVNGTFFAAMSIRTRNRELMLPLLLLPISVPAVITMVTATTQVLTGEGAPAVQMKFLAGFCVIFTTASFLLFETVLNAE
jgi:heme exporter protein B